MSLASTRITCVTHRQKAANSSHPHCLGFATLYTYPRKGKNTHPETTLCFLQLHHIIFALFLCSSLFFMPFNQMGLASPQQIGFVISEMMRWVPCSKQGPAQPVLPPWDCPSSLSVGHCPTPGLSDEGVPRGMLKGTHKPRLWASTFFCFYLKALKPL